MGIENGFVRCVGYRRSERLFTTGRIYKVVNGTIQNDNGYTYTNPWYSDKSVLDWLSDWYIFEPVEPGKTEIKCSLCGEVITDEYTWINGTIICDSCKEEHVYFCDCCGRAVLDEDSHYINDQTLCNHCVELNYITCDCCGELVYRYDSCTTSEGDRICEYCMEYCYRICYDCEELVHEDNAYWDDNVEGYLCECCHDRRKRIIKPYNFKPIPLFYDYVRTDENPLYMGVELEIDFGGEDSENAKVILDIANIEREHIYIKHDGSLEEGFEIVSHPATLDYHLNCIDWASISEKAVSMGYRSHDTDTCGLHVHVSRKALGESRDIEEDTISKILFFIENNWNCIMKFTRRTESNMNEWASRYGIECDIKSTYEKAKGDWNRYRCLNLMNEKTIEFRMFRGTLNQTTFRATLELVHNICTICKNTSADEIAGMNWEKFISLIDTEKYPELIEYCKIRKLIV